MKLNFDKVTEDEVLEQYELFLDCIVADNYKVIPSKKRFAEYLEVRPSKLNHWLLLHPNCEAKMKSMTADVIAEGAMLKKYVPQAAALALKNWCGWEDSPKTTREQVKQQERKEKKAEDALDEYIKEQKLKLAGKKKGKSASTYTAS